MEKGAIISPCEKFRYRLWRTWDASLPVLLFVMLNPSTADASENDPTIRKCIGFAQRLGFGGIEVLNLFAYRATDPADLKRAGYPAGPDNVAHLDGRIKAVQAASGVVVCAWGVNARNSAKAAEFVAWAASWRIPLYALRLTADGVPWHPLMLPYNCALERFGVPAAERVEA